MKNIAYIHWTARQNRARSTFRAILRDRATGNELYSIRFFPNPQSEREAAAKLAQWADRHDYQIDAADET